MAAGHTESAGDEDSAHARSSLLEEEESTFAAATFGGACSHVTMQRNDPRNLRVSVSALSQARVSSMSLRRSAYLTAKRALDLAGATTALVVLAPTMIVIALAIRVKMGRPILYGQLRPGWREAPIRVWKFRTMDDRRGSDEALLPDGNRLTLLGRWLREHSLDELPQLFNIVRGDMSFVGPRPLLLRYLPRYSSRQRRRHEIKPGITGWAQIHGRSALDWGTRFELDAWYVDNASFALDLKILALTAWKVLRRDGVLAGAGAELDEFWGAVEQPADGPRAPGREQRAVARAAPTGSETVNQRNFWSSYYGEVFEQQKPWLDYSNARVQAQTFGLAAAGPVDGAACLDVGCGWGQLARALVALGARGDRHRHRRERGRAARARLSRRRLALR
jgi:sugar transferase EpsL